jgi:alkylation response protein AidB-like acyl-CoA dehydrogenase
VNVLFLVTDAYGGHGGIALFNRELCAALDDRITVIPRVIRGEVRDAYAVTERDAGSDPSRIAATAERTADGFRLNGEKWFVTTGDVASVIVVMANVIDGEHKLPTLFAVDADAAGVQVIDDPAFTHSYPDGHPTFLFTDVELSADAVIGEVGEGNDLQRAWFMEERLGIAAEPPPSWQPQQPETLLLAEQRSSAANAPR